MPQVAIGSRRAFAFPAAVAAGALAGSRTARAEGCTEDTLDRIKRTGKLDPGVRDATPPNGALSTWKWTSSCKPFRCVPRAREFRRVADLAIVDLFANGAWDKIYDKYFGPKGVAPFEKTAALATMARVNAWADH
jgi:hypothetical protein